ncbi:hypothetical protein SAMN05660662_0746 [Blastococcus aurantiacus]|uniref:Uncharacterized protein n=1 Tax=Blastococcus aurantiacus TaxID=1550231 RepID=A0A1G7HPG6_9ACTN|nr:hypothetical protein [Blastococcus aurantiacus]SDF02300.1 hypothetical protein SAMN05660662_0746 [Blastococcus aurantiacus]
MRQTVTDQWGDGWKARARHVRGAGTTPPRPGPDADRMRRRLEAALERYPAPLVASATTDVRDAAAPISDPVDAELAEFRHQWHRPGTTVWVGLDAGPALLREGLARLRTPRSGTWEVGLVARGRFRRWARWQVSGDEAAVEVLAAVTAAVAAGRVPDPVGATLVEVVDHRPPFRPQPVP